MIARSAAALVALAALLTTAPAVRADDEAAKKEARALLQGGNKLRENGDLAGALALYESAYARFPSAKILLNIGTTLRDLDRRADAANAYARYLAAPDAGADRVPEVKRLLADLDRSLGQVAVTVEPTDAELAVGGDTFLPAATLPRWRVSPGEVVVRARKDGFEPTQATVTVKKGKVGALTLRLTAAAATSPTGPAGDTTGTGAPLTGDGGAAAPELRGAVAPARRSRLGVVGRALIDGQGRGAAGSAGALVRVHDRAEVVLAAIFARPQGELTVGGYGGVQVELGRGAWRPRLAAGLPLIVDDGARVGVRAAAGLAWWPSARFAVVLELGGEYGLNPADDIDAWQLTPTLGAEAHL